LCGPLSFNMTLHGSDEIYKRQAMMRANMSVRFDWKWFTDDTGEHVRVVVADDQRPEGVEICRILPGRTDDRTGCVIRAIQVCDAMRLLVRGFE